MFVNLNNDGSEILKYDNADYPIRAFKALLSSYPNYSAPSHWHDDIELICVLSGEMQYNVNGKVITLNENEGIFVNSRQLHCGFSEKKAECKFICALFHPLLLCSLPSYERDFVLPILNNRNIPFILLKNIELWQKNILDSVKQIYSVKDDKTAPLKLQSIFVHIWSVIFENVPYENQNSAQNSDLSILRNMIGYIQKNYSEKITLADICASGSVGQSKCCKLFSEFLGQTPNSYLNLYRLNKGAELLKSGDLSVTEIAFAVGFGGSSYFAEAFKKWSGKTPTQYR